MGVNQAAVFQVWLDGLGKESDEIESLLREDDERRDHSDHDRTGNPEKALSQLLEMIEEGHLSLGSYARLRHRYQPNTRSRSRASSASSDDGYF